MITACAQGTPGSIDKLLRCLDTIVTLPELTVRINAVINDPNSSAADLHRIVSHDPALVSRLLRLVNSALYGRQTSIDSVQRAIVFLGFEGVYQLAIAATMGPLFKGGKICEGFTAKDLWTHCVAVAAVARELAAGIGTVSPEEAFLVGLLHDVGLLVALRACRGQLRQVCEQAIANNTPFTEIEAPIVGAGHSELGSALAKLWKFPPGVREVAHHHHNPLAAPESLRALAVIVHVADVLCCQQHIGFYMTAEKQVLDPAVYQELISQPLLDIAREMLPKWVAPAIELFS
jgi:HD-like signal output (HDOD) protein